MEKTNKQKFVIYIGDFDLRNQNVQAHLVKNNAKILNRLGYRVAFIGINRESSSVEIETLPKLSSLGDGNLYLELENTFSVSGLLKYRKTEKKILSFIEKVEQDSKVEFVISYQAPTYALILKSVAQWCKYCGAKYIVNCADLTLFSSQPLFRRAVMELNWKILHGINKQYADGIIAVSSYIENFYHKDGLPSVIIPPLFDNYSESEFKLGDKTTFVYAGTPFVLKENVNPEGMKDRLDKIVDYCILLSKQKVNYVLEIIGITKEQYLMCIPRHKEDLRDNDDIKFKGRFSHEDTLKEVRNADYMMNIRDINIMNEAGLSTKLVESVSLGTPVVMNSVGDNFKYLREGITGYELFDDKQRDVELLKVLCNKSIEERMTLKRNCVGDKAFSIERFEGKLESFLSEVCLNG